MQMKSKSSMPWTALGWRPYTKHLVLSWKRVCSARGLRGRLGAANLLILSFAELGAGVEVPLVAAPLVVAEGILRKEEIFVAPQVSNCTKLYLCIVRHTGFYRFYSSPSPLLGAWRLPGEAGEKEELEEYLHQNGNTSCRVWKRNRCSFVTVVLKSNLRNQIEAADSIVEYRGESGCSAE